MTLKLITAYNGCILRIDSVVFFQFRNEVFNIVKLTLKNNINQMLSQ